MVLMDAFPSVDSRPLDLHRPSPCKGMLKYITLVRRGFTEMFTVMHGVKCYELLVYCKRACEKV